MDKQSYIKEVKENLSKYNISNIYDVLADYEQIIDEIMYDNDNNFDIVIDKLGNPTELSNDIINELGYEKKNNKEDYQRTSTSDYRNHRQKSNVIWQVVLIIYYIINVSMVFLLAGLIFIGAITGFQGKVAITDNKTTNTLSSASLSITYCNKKECTIFYRNHDGFSFKPIYRIENNVNINKTIFKTCHFNTKNLFETCNTNNTNYLNNNDDSFNDTIALSLGLLLAISIAVIIFIGVLLYVLIRMPIKTIIHNNNEYNRRRNNE
ncbi:MAG: hypothetical protein LBT75_03695 [Bacilli bacterium]|nr:hypothetical protein [Bacilli bacterium]